jgi:putative membrane protein
MANVATENAQEPEPRTDLAAQRTQLAWDRTLLAWIRTALSLMASGVALDKGIQFLHERRLTAGTAWLNQATWVHSAHIIRISLTAISTLLLAIIARNHIQGIRTLAETRHRNPPRVTVATVAAVIVVIFGCAVVAVLIMSSN